METAIIGLIGSIITGVLALMGVIYTNNQSNKKVENQLITSQAVTDTKIENLTNEVKRHNEFGVRIPRIEAQLENLTNEVKELKER